VPFVVDASVVIAWALEEGHPTASAAAARIDSEQTWVPALWWFEVRNGLLMNERRGRVREVRTGEFLTQLAALALSVDATPGEMQVLVLARRHRLTVYDAAYLELALRRALPLATLDIPLARAARAEGVPLVGESG
jgi:predicted nucleic acid-binding protein